MALDMQKDAFISMPVLGHFDRNRHVIVEMDTSDYISAGVLSKYDDDNVLHLVAYFSNKPSPVEYNHEMKDKELIPIVRAFEEWPPELQSIITVTDHQSYTPGGYNRHSWTVDHHHNCGDGVCYVKEMKIKPLQFHLRVMVSGFLLLV
jgi:hypothetical protein